MLFDSTKGTQRTHGEVSRERPLLFLLKPFESRCSLNEMTECTTKPISFHLQLFFFLIFTTEINQSEVRTVGMICLLKSRSLTKILWWWHHKLGSLESFLFWLNMACLMITASSGNNLYQTSHMCLSLFVHFAQTYFTKSVVLTVWTVS